MSLTLARHETIIPQAVPVMPRKQPAFGPSTSFFALFCVLLLCVASIHCGESCISGVINPPGSMVQVKTCSITTSNGTMNVTVPGSGGLAKSASSSNSFGVRHIFVAVSGIEVQANSSSRWEEIAPALGENPVQLDLLANAPAEEIRLVEAQVAPGNYSALRLRLASEYADANLTIGGNPCREAGPDCAVISDAAIRPLRFEAVGQGHGIRGLPVQIPEGFLRVMPDTQTDVQIVFQGAASSAVEFGGAIHLVPVLKAEMRGFAGIAGRP